MKTLGPVGDGAAVLHVSRGKSERLAVSLAKALCSIRASVATENSDIESGRGWRHPPKHSLETTRGLDAKKLRSVGVNARRKLMEPSWFRPLGGPLVTGGTFGLGMARATFRERPGGPRLSQTGQGAVG